jgi:hypothetical protein
MPKIDMISFFENELKRQKIVFLSDFLASAHIGLRHNELLEYLSSKGIKYNSVSEGGTTYVHVSDLTFRFSQSGEVLSIVTGK